MSDFERRSIFYVYCKVRSARHRNNLEEVFSRLTVKDFVKIAVFNTPLVCRKNLILNLRKLFL